MDLGLEGRIAIVTGGSQGIGRAIADVLVEEGAAVAICARRREPLEAAAAEINAAGGRAFSVVADVGDTASVDAMVERVVAEFGRVDVLVNNAGVPGGLANGPIATVTDEKMWEDPEREVHGRGALLAGRRPPYEEAGVGAHRQYRRAERPAA